MNWSNPVNSLAAMIKAVTTNSNPGVDTLLAGGTVIMNGGGSSQCEVGDVVDVEFSMVLSGAATSTRIGLEISNGGSGTFTTLDGKSLTRHDFTAVAATAQTFSAFARFRCTAAGNFNAQFTGFSNASDATCAVNGPNCRTIVWRAS